MKTDELAEYCSRYILSEMSPLLFSLYQYDVLMSCKELQALKEHVEDCERLKGPKTGNNSIILVVPYIKCWRPEKAQGHFCPILSAGSRSQTLSGGNQRAIVVVVGAKNPWPGTKWRVFHRCIALMQHMVPIRALWQCTGIISVAVRFVSECCINTCMWRGSHLPLSHRQLLQANTFTIYCASLRALITMQVCPVTDLFFVRVRTG